jgi:hypothetical protein
MTSLLLGNGSALNNSTKAEAAGGTIDSAISKQLFLYFSEAS